MSATSSVAVVTDSTHLPAARPDRALGDRAGEPLRRLGRRPAARARVRARRLLRPAARLSRPSLDLPALGRRLPRLLRAARRRRPRRRLRAHRRAASRAPARAPARRRGSSPTRGSRAGSRSSTARPAPAGSAASSSPRLAPPSRAWRWPRSSTPSTRPARGSRCGSASTPSSTCARAVASGRRRPWSGSALKIKPILTFGTEITPVGRVRTRRARPQQMVDYLHELHDRGASDWFVQHAQSADDADALVARGHRDLRQRAALLHPGRPGARRPPRLRNAGRRHRLPKPLRTEFVPKLSTSNQGQ